MFILVQYLRFCEYICVSSEGATPTTSPVEPSGFGESGASGTDDQLSSGSGDQPSGSPDSSGDSSGASGTDDLLSSGSGDQPSGSPDSSGDSSGASGTDDLLSSGSGDQPSGSPVSSGDCSGASGTDDLLSSGSGDQPSGSPDSSGDSSGASGTDDLLSSGSGDQPSGSPVSSGDSSGASGTDDLLSSGSGDQPSGSPDSSGDSSGASCTDDLLSSGSGDQLSGSPVSSGDSSGASGTDCLSGSGSGDQLSGSFVLGGDSSGVSVTDDLLSSGSGDQSSGSFVSSGDSSGASWSGDLPSGYGGASGSASGLDIIVTFSESDSIFSGVGSASGKPEEAGKAGTEILTFPFGQGSGLFGLDTYGSGSGSGSGFSSEESGSTSDFSSSSGESDESGDLSGISSGSGYSEESSGFSGFPSEMFPSGGFSGISFIDCSGEIMVDSPLVKVSTAPHLTDQELGGSHVDFSGSGQISGSGMSGDISGMSGDISEVSGVNSGSRSGLEFSGLTFLGSGFIDLTEKPSEQEASGLLLFGSGDGSGFTSGGFTIESGERSGDSASGDIIFSNNGMVEMSNKPFQGMELGRGEVEYSGSVRLSSGSGDDQSAFASGQKHEWIPVTEDTPAVISSYAPSDVISAQGPSGLYSDAAGYSLPPLSEPEGIMSKLDTVTVTAALSSTTEPTSLQSPSVTEGLVANGKIPFVENLFKYRTETRDLSVPYTLLASINYFFNVSSIQFYIAIIHRVKIMAGSFMAHKYRNLFILTSFFHHVLLSFFLINYNSFS